MSAYDFLVCKLTGHPCPLGSSAVAQHSNALLLLPRETAHGASQSGHKLSDKPIIPDERFARHQPKREEPKQPEPEPTLASKYGIILPGVPMEGTNTYTGVQSAEDLSSNLPVIVSADTTVAHTGIGRGTNGGNNTFGFTGAADQAHSAAYGGSGSANSPEAMAKKAAEVTSALGVTEHIAGI
ncbi:hypothetical protein ABBQ38_010387 [Trebouxia sp. C0009 RCD-2024]